MELNGMWTASKSKANNPKGTWSENTRNIVISKDGKSVLNEDGFATYASGYPTTLRPNGFLALYNDEFLVWSVNKTDEATASEIGKINVNGFYEPIIRDPKLNLRIEHPISATKRYNIYGELEAVFTDNYNNLRILNIDNLPFEVDNDLNLVDAEKFNNINVFPEVKIPEFHPDVKENGGSIETGVVYFTGQYEDYTGALTNTFPLSNPIHVLNYGSTYANTGGSESGTLTANSIDLGITNIDTRFKKLRIIAVKKFNGQLYGWAFNTIKINNSTTLNTIYTGTEEAENVPLSEILVDKASYTKAAVVMSADDILYVANPSSKERLNIQKYINNWKVKYITDTVKLNTLEGSLKDGKTFFIKRPFHHNEVYALYGVVTLNNGNYQYAFHIPGRPPRAIQNFSSGGLDETTLNSDLTSLQSYLGEDLEIDINSRYYQTRDTSSLDGTLGYWENQNESYPNTDDWDIVDDTDSVVGTLRNEKVRHHKMPSIDRLEYADLTNQEAPIIGLEISNIYLPDDIKDQIQNIEIFYAKRTGKNNQLAGSSLVFFGAQYYEDPTIIGSNAGNWNIDPGNGGGTKFITAPTSTVLRFHPFDMLVDKPNMLPNFIYNNTKITSEFKIDSINNTGSAFLSMDLTDPSKNTVYGVADANKVFALKEQQYAPFNTILGNGITNRYSEEVFLAKLKTTPASTNPIGLTIVSFDMNDTAGTIHTNHQTYVTDLMIWREDCYLDFSRQELASTGHRIDFSSSTTQFFGGDAYYGTQGIILSADNENTMSDTDQNDGIRTKVKFYIETSNAPELQYGSFYPKEDIEINISNQWEYPIQYNKDYTSINSYNVVTIVDLEERDVNTFPNRILRTGANQREAKVSAWRTFLVNNYYETAKDRGRIINLESINGEILIQHEYGLYITRGSETFETDVSTVQVGSGDVFRIPPKEIVDTKDGYVGCQSRFACLKFPGGYLTCDANQGKIFIMDNSLNEVSSEAMYDWFRENLIIKRNVNNNEFDNLFNYDKDLNLTTLQEYSVGIIAAYDEVNKRILITKKETYLTFEREEASLPPQESIFTVSYNIPKKEWIALHDYIPNGINYSANKVISCKNGSIFLHNVPDRKGLYYTSEKFPSYIEFVVNEIATTFVQSLNWRTQYEKEDVILEDKTIDSVLIYNHNQCSDYRSITLRKTTRNAEGIWRFNDFRDLVKNPKNIFLDDKGNVISSNIATNKPFFKQDRFRGNYLCTRLIFSNLENNAEITISEFGINDKISYR